MIERSYDFRVAAEAAGILPRNDTMNWELWLADEKNVMAVSGDNVGMATYEYPGVYTIHWFFVARGREALNLAKEMLDYFFQNYPVQLVRGLTPENIKGARWLARQVGLKSFGFLQFPDGPYELLCITKDEFYEGNPT